MDKKTIFLKIASVGRFVLGLVLLGVVFWWFPTHYGESPIFILMMMVTPSPLLFFLWPIVAGAVYFIFTAKFRWRIDIIASILIIVSLWGMFTLAASSSKNNEDISGNAALKVVIMDEAKRPVADLEVDVSTTPGAPPKGGVLKTNEYGTANFSLKPGKYYIFFNSNGWPAQYVQPNQDVSVEVNLEKEMEQQIILKSK